MTKFRFTKFGLAENPIGRQVKWQVGERTYLADVRGVYRDETRGFTMLRVSHFCGEPAPDVCASIVEIIG